MASEEQEIPRVLHRLLELGSEIQQAQTAALEEHGVDTEERLTTGNTTDELLELGFRGTALGDEDMEAINFYAAESARTAEKHMESVDMPMVHGLKGVFVQGMIFGARYQARHGS